MKHIRKFESYKVTKQIDKIIKESALQVGDLYKVRNITDVPQSLINSIAKAVKDQTGKNVRTFYSDVDIAEIAVSHILTNHLNLDSVPPTVFMGGDVQVQGQGQAQAQVPQGQPQAQPAQIQAQPAQIQAQPAQAQPQAQDLGQAQPQGQSQDIPQTQSEDGIPPQIQSQSQDEIQDEDDFEEVKEESEEEEDQLPL